MGELRALLFGEPVRVRPAYRVLACAGATVRSESDPKALVEAAQRFAPTVALVQLSALTSQRTHILERLAALPKPPTIILLSEATVPEGLPEWVAAPWFAHLLGLDSPWFMTELGVTVAKLHGQPIFDVSKYLPWGTRFIDVPVAGSASKAQAFDRIADFMNTLGVRGRFIDRVHAVADEFLMNAIYDAPVNWRTGAPIHHSRPRSEPVVLDPDQAATLRFGSDGRTLAISISDPFGGLAPDTVRRYIAKGLRRGEDQIDDKAGGAGLGLFLLFESLGSMILDVHRGRRTEVMGLIDIRGSVRDARRTPKSLNLFERR